MKMPRNEARAWQDQRRAVDLVSLSSLEDDWFSERMRGIATISEDLIDDSYFGSNSDGDVQSKPQFLASIARSTPSFDQGHQKDRELRVYRDIAISSGVAELSSAKRNHAFRYVRIFKKARGSWKLIYSQSTRIAGHA
ncbi:nuclear transport factor 2 family protein [Bradyrhizobium sp. McL0616]|uniref:nuclear transport factor 2 family protein n=1 Tax=Bradyrhizobium sp. McL0616 TaxID=3415674 RepID=UPI003CF8769B